MKVLSVICSETYLLCYASTTIVFPAEGDEVPDFIGAPYEFWVGGNVGVGTSIGQIRMTDAVRNNHVGYDLLHSYHDGGKGYLILTSVIYVKLIAICGETDEQYKTIHNYNEAEPIPNPTYIMLVTFCLHQLTMVITSQLILLESVNLKVK